MIRSFISNNPVIIRIQIVDPHNDHVQCGSTRRTSLPVSRLASPGRCPSESARWKGEKSLSWLVVSNHFNDGCLYDLWIFIMWFVCDLNMIYIDSRPWQVMYFDICSTSYLDSIGNCNLQMCYLKPPAQLYPRCFFRWSFKCCTDGWPQKGAKICRESMGNWEWKYSYWWKANNLVFDGENDDELRWNHIQCGIPFLDAIP